MAITFPISAVERTRAPIPAPAGAGVGNAVPELVGYRFLVAASHPFTLVAGKPLELALIGYQRHPLTTPLEERPALRFEERHP